MEFTKKTLTVVQRLTSISFVALLVYVAIDSESNFAWPEVALGCVVSKYKSGYDWGVAA